jgi:ABC-type transporter Mla MlaB component
MARRLLSSKAFVIGACADPGAIMLRMTRTDAGPTTTIFVEGKILGPWIPEIHSAIKAIPDGQTRRLDLAGVTFVDAAGAQLLSSLQQNGIEIASCSHFISDLLDRYARNPL